MRGEERQNKEEREKMGCKKGKGKDEKEKKKRAGRKREISPPM